MKVLIACSKKKLPAGVSPVPAYRLYQGALFQAQWEYARLALNASPVDVFILSAKYGLLPASEPVWYYEATLPGATKARLPWATRVWRDTQTRFLDGEEIYILAGRRYRDPLLSLMGDCFRVTNPIPAGMGYAEQVKWLTAAINGVNAPN